MDGTLLDASGMRVSPRNAAALQRAQAAGARVVIATGRPVWWLGPVREIGFTGTAVCMNGAVVYDIGSDEIRSARPMEPDIMKKFVDGLADQVGDFGLAVERLGTSIRECWAEPAYEHPWGLGEFQMCERAELLAAPAAKMLIRTAGRNRGRLDSGQLAAAARAAQVPEVGITYSSDEGLLEVAAAGVSKGAALEELARQWAIDPVDVIAFGDMPNDLEMLNWAGRPVAMSNGHPEVQAVAVEVAPHHDDDGVAHVLERWF